MHNERKRVTTITINTDASYYSDCKVGGYAFYIVCDLFKITKGGMFKVKPNNSTEAEIMCIGNAIATLLAQKELPECKWLVINTDSKHGIEAITKQKTKLGLQVYRLWGRLITRLGTKHNKFRHVKAHSGVQDARSFVNEWCDREAKKWAKKAYELSNIKKSVPLVTGDTIGGTNVLIIEKQ